MFLFHLHRAILTPSHWMKIHWNTFVFVSLCSPNEAKVCWSSSCLFSDLHPSASLSVSPDRVQHFTSDSVSLSCEGNSAEWRVSRFLLPDFLSFCSDWGTMNGSTCHVQKIQSSNAVYWCESGSAFSNAVNITGHCEWKHVWIPIFSLTFIIGLIWNTCRSWRWI